MKTTEIAFAIELVASLSDPDLHTRLVTLKRAMDESDAAVQRLAMKESELAQREQDLVMETEALAADRATLDNIKADLVAQQGALYDRKARQESYAKEETLELAKRRAELDARTNELKLAATDLCRREDALTAATIALNKREAAFAEKYAFYAADMKVWEEKLNRLKSIWDK